MKLMNTLMACAIAATMTMAPLTASAQDAPMKVAVLNVDGLRVNATAFKHVQEQLKVMRDKLQAEIKKEEDDLGTSSEALKRQRTILAPDVFAAERRKFEQRVADLQRMVQGRLKNIDQVRAAAIQQIEQASNEIVSELAKTEELSMIFKSSNLIFSHNSLDITKVVLDRLNAKLPKLQLKEPGK